MDMIANTSIPLPFNATVGYNFTALQVILNSTSTLDSFNYTNSTDISILITQSTVLDNDTSSVFFSSRVKDTEPTSTKGHKTVEPGFPITYLSDNAAKSTPPRLHGLVKQFDKVHVGKDSLDETLTGGRQLSNGHMAAAVVSSVCVFILVVILWIYCRKPYNYQKIQSDESSKYEYIYKPLAGGTLDEEYENTFVGVSIPLLQDNTKV